MFFFKSIAIFQAVAIRLFATISTEMRLAIACSSTSILRNTPLPAAINKPTGPFKLSTHPGIGSFRLGITKLKNYVEIFSSWDKTKTKGNVKLRLPIEGLAMTNGSLG